MDAEPDQAFVDRLLKVGEKAGKTVRFSRQDILDFVRISGDANPLHSAAQDVQRARFGEIIASGQHTAAMLMGLLASHFSRRDDAVMREMLCLNVNFSFKGPVFADQDLRLSWRVASVEWNGKLDGALAQLDGAISVGRARPAVVARGTILVKHAPS